MDADLGDIDEMREAGEACYRQFISSPPKDKASYIGGFVTGAVREHARIVDKITAAKEREEKYRAALCDAARDIREWQQLARSQREMMDQNLGWCPTQAGIDASDRTLAKIAEALLRTPASDAARARP